MTASRISPGLDRDLAEQLQTFDTRFLLAVHHGDVDVLNLVRRELASRGLDGAGRWVGFAQAAAALGV